eukprot:810004-Pelagomonas_calceolata.AAC.1
MKCTTFQYHTGTLYKGEARPSTSEHSRLAPNLEASKQQHRHICQHLSQGLSSGYPTYPNPVQHQHCPPPAAGPAAP